MTETDPAIARPAQVKSCCADAYARDVVGLILGPSFHPGGLALTRRLADALALKPGQRVLDVASGPGTTALLLAAEYGVRVEGVDYSPDLVERANAAAKSRGLAHRAVFRVGDAEKLPFGKGTFDAVVCECAFCTFPGKKAAAAEFARVLRPGGRLGVTDVTVEPGSLPAELANLAGTIACLADARSAAEYTRILAGARLRATRTEDHSTAMADMISRIQARLKVLAMIRPVPKALKGVDVNRALDLCRIAEEAVRTGAAGYALITAESVQVR